MAHPARSIESRPAAVPSALPVPVPEADLAAPWAANEFALAVSVTVSQYLVPEPVARNAIPPDFIVVGVLEVTELSRVVPFESYNFPMIAPDVLQFTSSRYQ
jgi:hypothetical protein